MRDESDSEVVAQPLKERRFGPVTRTDIVRYQGASGDFNPMHHDEFFARAAGMPSVLSVGMLQAGYLATYCAELFGPDKIRRFRVRFVDKVWPGDVLVCGGTQVREKGPEASVLVQLEMRREDGTLVATSTAEFAPDSYGPEAGRFL